jgi:hypothetical protein
MALDIAWYAENIGSKMKGVKCFEFDKEKGANFLDSKSVWAQIFKKWL